MANKALPKEIQLSNSIVRISMIGVISLSAYRIIVQYLSNGVITNFEVAYLVVLAWATFLLFSNYKRFKGYIEGLTFFLFASVILDLIMNSALINISLLLTGLFLIVLSVLSLKAYFSISRNISGSQQEVSIYDEKTESKAENKEELRSEYAVELVDVYKDYVVGSVVVKALRGMNLKVKRGEFVAIMGPSGSGKSTTLNLIGALDRPTRGKVFVDGVDISTLNDDELSELRNKKIGFIFQTFNLINRTTVLGNVIMPSIVSGLSKKERIEKAKRLLKLVGLEKEMNRSPRFLSGGQQQRVAIARALMNDPSIILADEPTGNLDTKTGNEVMGYLRKLNRELGTTVIVVTHDPDVAKQADRIIYIRDGRVVKEEVLRG